MRHDRSSFRWRLLIPSPGIRFSIDPLHQAAKYATRPDFIHLIDTLGKQPADRIFPENWADDLLDEQVANFFGIVVRFGVDIGNDRNSRLAKFHFFQDSGQTIDGRLHQRRVKRPGDRERNRFHRAGGRCGSFNSAAGGFGSGDDDVAGAKNVGNLQHFALGTIAAELFDLLALEAQGC